GTCGVHCGDQGVRVGIGLRTHHHRGCRVLRTVCGNTGAHVAEVDALAVEVDNVVVVDFDQDVLRRIRRRRRRVVVRVLVTDVDGLLLQEAGGNHEENQQDENHVQHGREVDVGFVLLAFYYGAAYGFHALCLFLVLAAWCGLPAHREAGAGSGRVYPSSGTQHNRGGENHGGGPEPAPEGVYLRRLARVKATCSARALGALPL